MAGTNPYIEKAEFELPQQNYNLIFQPMNKKVEILAEKITTENDGLPGSILNIALAAGIDLDHSCGGVCACSTCHIIVREGLGSCNVANDDEEDMLDLAPGSWKQAGWLRDPQFPTLRASGDFLIVFALITIC